MDPMIQTLARELGRTEENVQNVVTLIDEGATIPFIARYRKELHGSMDDQLLRQLADRLQYLRNLDARKGEVKTSIEPGQTHRRAVRRHRFRRYPGRGGGPVPPL